MKLHTGLVLFSFYPKKYKVALLDNKLGRIDAALMAPRVKTGTLLEYNLSGRHGRYLVDHISIIDLPLSLAREDILFLHHVLELAFHFIPIGSCINGIFALLILLYKARSTAWNVTVKKIFLCKLFLALGVHQESETMHMRWIKEIEAISLNNDAIKKLDISCIEAIDLWLAQCVAQHPYSQKFKTIKFLTKFRMS